MRPHLTTLGAMVASVGLAGYAVFGPTTQLFGSFPYRAPTAEKVVALSFDDGPNEPYTSQLLGVLAERGVLATFFQVGMCVERHPGLSRRMAAAGHVIGNHSYRHQLSRYLTEPSLRSEIAATQRVLELEIGRRPALFRPPWLCHQPALLREVRRQELQVVSGTFAHPLEVMQPSAERIARGAVARSRPGSVLIFHDGFDARGGYRGQTVAAISLVVDTLTAAGFAFTTVDKLLGVTPYQD